MSFITFGRNEAYYGDLVKKLWPEWDQYFFNVTARFWPPDQGIVRIDFKKDLYGTPVTVCVLNLVEQPACCGVAVSIYTTLVAEMWGKGLGRRLLKLKEDMAKELRYSVLQATVSWNDSPAEVHILRTTPGWIHDYTYLNKRTFNIVCGFHKILWSPHGMVLAPGQIAEAWEPHLEKCSCMTCRQPTEMEEPKKRVVRKKKDLEITEDPELSI